MSAPSRPADGSGEAMARLQQFITEHAAGMINWLPDGCPINAAPGGMASGLTIGDLRALVAASSAPGVAAEWMLVPVEPSEDMLRAMHRQIDWCRDDHDTSELDCRHPDGGTSLREDLMDAWRDGLAAAPQPLTTDADKRYTERKPPCHFGGGNDGVVCTVCGVGYDPCRGETKPDCGAAAYIEALKDDARLARAEKLSSDIGAAETSLIHTHVLSTETGRTVRVERAGSIDEAIARVSVEERERDAYRVGFEDAYRMLGGSLPDETARDLPGLRRALTILRHPNAGMEPPDGGSPTQTDRVANVAEEIAELIDRLTPEADHG